MTNAIYSTIPVCPDCKRVLLRLDWFSKRPHSHCDHCGLSFWYAQDGRIVMRAKTTRRAA